MERVSLNSYHGAQYGFDICPVCTALCQDGKRHWEVVHAPGERYDGKALEVGGVNAVITPPVHEGERWPK